MPPPWLFSILGIGALGASAIHIGKALAEGAGTGRIVRAVIWALLGAFWLYMSRQGKKNSDIDDDARAKSADQLQQQPRDGAAETNTGSSTRDNSK